MSHPIHRFDIVVAAVEKKYSWVEIEIADCPPNKPTEKVASTVAAPVPAANENQTHRQNHQNPPFD